MTIDAVVFDIGNVLINWNPEAFYDRTIGEPSRRRLFEEVPLHAMNLEVDLGADFHSSVVDLAAQHPDWHDAIMMWHDHWLDMASPAINHSVHLLRALRRAAIPVFALSNFGRETFRIAEANYPFLEEFDARFISGQMGVMKPDAEIYARLEQETGVTPSALLFADDREENIAAADARGWQTHLFDGPKGFAARLVACGLLTEEQVA